MQSGQVSQCNTYVREVSFFFHLFIYFLFFEEAAHERAHHSQQTPIKCIKENDFGFLVCFEGTNGKMS